MTSIKGRSAFSLWFAGETVSQLGTSLAMLGWTLLAYSVTHDVRAAALVGALRTATQIVTVLPGGLISDRLDRRSLLLLDAGVEVLLYGVLAAFIVTDVLSLGLLAALAVIQGACSGALGSVRHTVLPDLVEEDELGEAVARMQTRDAVIATLGPPLGGVLYGIGPVVPFVSNVVLSAMEWAFTTRLPRQLGTLDRERPTEPLRAALFAGFGWLRRSRAAQTLLLLGLIGNCAVISLAIGLNLHLQATGQGAWRVGVVDGVAGIGLVLGGMLAHRVMGRWPARELIAGAMLTMAVIASVLAVTHSFRWMVGLALFLFMPVPTVAVAAQPYLLGLIPDELRGRVLTAAGLASLVFSSSAQALSGLVLDWAGFEALAGGVAVLLLLAAAVGTFSDAVRNIPAPDAESAG